MRAKHECSYVKHPPPVPDRQSSDRYLIRLVEEPSDSREITPGGTELHGGIKFDLTLSISSTDAIYVNSVESLLMSSGAAPMCDSLIKWREAFERRSFTFL